MDRRTATGDAICGLRAVGWRVQSPRFAAEDLRKAFACFPSGVVALCGLREGAPVGMSVSSFTSVSLDPPLVSVCIARQSSTWQVLRHLPRIGLSVLAEDHDQVCRALASRDADRFGSVSWQASERGAVLIADASLHIECSIEREIDAGDHLLVLLAIETLKSEPAVAPLVFHGSRFRQLGPAGT